MKKIRKIYIFLITSILLFSASLVAQTSSEIAFTKIEVAIANGSADTVFDILSENNDQPFFPELEEYVLEQARQLVIQNELDLARDVTLALIDNNLDNFDAVDLYTSIDKAIAKRESSRLAIEEKQQLEEMRVQVAAARTRQALQKEYKTITNTVSGETVYLDQDINSHFIPLSWNIALGMANIGIVTTGTSLSVKYGLLMDADILYNAERFAIGADIGADVLLLSFAGNDDMIFHIRAVPEFSISALSSKLFFRAGFNGNLGNNKTKTSMNQFLSPVLGVGFKNLGKETISNLSINGYADYLMGHLFNEDVNFAMELNANASLILADLDTIDIFFYAGLRCGIFAQDDFHSQTRIIVGVGVGNND